MTFIGILAAIALPAYQDYISKSQTTRVVGELAAGKTAVDAALFEGKKPVMAKTDKAEEEQIGLTEDNGTTPRSNLMSAVVLTGFENNGAGTIDGTIGNRANKDILGTVVTQSRSEQGVWSCIVEGKGSGWKPKFIPTGCTAKP
ncbi:pilin [Moraxella bovis]|uniref:pilin n=1 Tax=Moraxella bovis TaxID=476 RepID=UPI0022260179|nr:pilin [Moraxella bovis]